MAREISYNNFEISLVVFMPNITTNHAITYTNLERWSKFAFGYKFGSERVKLHLSSSLLPFQAIFVMFLVISFA